MIRVTHLLSLIAALAAFTVTGCSVGTETSDDVIDTTGEQSLTHVTESTDQPAATPAKVVRGENLGFVNARSVGAGPQPDPWAPVADLTDPAGPQPDPWKPGSSSKRVTSTGSLTPDKH